MREFDIINKFFKPLSNSEETALGLNDDVAKISLKKDEELVISKDIFVEDVHFLKKDGGYKIAAKLLRTNLSDIAASGATPFCYMLGFSKNAFTNKKFLTEFSKGLEDTQKEFGLFLIGGDTVKSKNLVFSITIFGKVKKSQILRRCNAKPDDYIFVSGTIGDAYLGLNHTKDEYLLQRHFFPSPRVKLGQILLKNNISQCAIDVSDGLLSDINDICQSSKLSAEIFEDKIPFSPSAQKFIKNNQVKTLDLISGGDDYELVFSVKSTKLDLVKKLSHELKINLTCIGKFVKSDKKHSIKLINKSGKKIRIKKFGYEH